jgi:hypothetical protein
MATAAAQALSGASDPVRAPLFRSLVERMEDGGRWVILDLGPARPQNIELFGRFRCRLEIADLAADLDALVPAEDAGEEALKEQIEGALPARNPEPVDIVFCWDLLNYLQPAILPALSSRLAARALPGTLVHALVAYRDPLMPAQPGGFFPVDGEHLTRRNAGPDERPAPRYSPEQLGNAFRDFSIERAILLGNGMQEFLFRR